MISKFICISKSLFLKKIFKNLFIKRFLVILLQHKHFYSAFKAIYSGYLWSLKKVSNITTCLLYGVFGGKKRQQIKIKMEVFFI